MKPSWNPFRNGILSSQKFRSMPVLGESPGHSSPGQDTERWPELPWSCGHSDTCSGQASSSKFKGRPKVLLWLYRGLFFQHKITHKLFPFSTKQDKTQDIGQNIPPLFQVLTKTNNIENSEHFWTRPVRKSLNCIPFHRSSYFFFIYSVCHVIVKMIFLYTCVFKSLLVFNWFCPASLISSSLTPCFKTFPLQGSSRPSGSKSPTSKRLLHLRGAGGALLVVAQWHHLDLQRIWAIWATVKIPEDLVGKGWTWLCRFKWTYVNC